MGLLHTTRSAPFYILLERKCAREDASVGGNIKNSMSHKFYNVTAYACVLSDTFPPQEDIEKSNLSGFLIRVNTVRYGLLKIYES